MAGAGTNEAVEHPLLTVLDTAYDHPSWHGVNLRGSLRRVPLDMAVWRPRPGAHNTWELVVHAAYWKYAAWRRLSGAARGSFPLIAGIAARDLYHAGQIQLLKKLFRVHTARAPR